MSVRESQFSFSSHPAHGVEQFILKWWGTLREILFGVMYTMAKENTLPKYFVLANVIIEFLQMIIFCLRPEYHWTGVHFGADISIGLIGYDIYVIFFWFVVSLLVLAALNVSYIGYSFHQGEVRSILLLRTLRWICCLFVTVLFIPFLYILLAGLACDYSTVPSKLMLFPNVECWGKRHIPIGIVSIIMLVIFSVFSLFTGLMYYEYDPTVIRASGRLQNRFEFGALWIKMLLVFMNLFLSSHAVIFAAVSFFSMFVNFVGYLTLLPAYDYKMNLIRSGSYAGIFWVYLCTIIAIVINDSNNPISVVALVAGLPCAIALGSFSAVKRFKYVCNPQLIEAAFVTNENLEEAAVQQTKPSLKKVVKWEQPGANKVVKNKLYHHLIFPTDVEMASRFVLGGNPNAALIEKAKVVFQTGLGKFPKSPSVLQAYANFLFYVVGDWQMGYLTLEKLRKMKPPIDIDFFIYRHDKDREQRTQGGNDLVGNFVDFMEFRKLQQAARRYHMMALVSIRRFWRCLLDSKVDVMKLSDLSSRIANSEKSTADQYEKLLTSYPKNIRVLRDYARFLDEIVRDERSAHEIWKKADKYEELEMAKNTESHRSQQQATPINGPDEEEDALSEIKSDHTSETSFDEDALSMTSGSSGVTSRIALARFEKNSQLKKLGWLMFFTTLFILGVTFTQLGVMNSGMGDYMSTVQTLDGAGGTSHQGVRVSILAFDAYILGMQAAAQNNLSLTLPYYESNNDYGGLVGMLASASYLFGNDVKSIYWGTSNSEPFTSSRRLELKKQAGFKITLDPTSHSMAYNEFDHKISNHNDLIKYLNSPIFNMTLFLIDYSVPNVSLTTIFAQKYEAAVTLTDAWSIDMLFADNGVDISHATINDMTTAQGTVSLFGLSFFEGSNAIPVTESSRGLMQLCKEHVDWQLNLLVIVCLVIFCVSAALLILAAAFLFRPMVSEIFKYKIRTLYIFTLIPSSVVKHMARKKISSLGHDHDEEHEPQVDPDWNEEPVEPPMADSDDEAAYEEETPGNPADAAILHTPKASATGDKKNLLLPNAMDDEADYFSEPLPLTSLSEEGETKVGVEMITRGGGRGEETRGVEMETRGERKREGETRGGVEMVRGLDEMARGGYSPTRSLPTKPRGRTMKIAATQSLNNNNFTNVLGIDNSPASTSNIQIKVNSGLSLNLASANRAKLPGPSPLVMAKSSADVNPDLAIAGESKSENSPMTESHVIDVPRENKLKKFRKHLTALKFTNNLRDEEEEAFIPKQPEPAPATLPSDGPAPPSPVEGLPKIASDKKKLKSFETDHTRIDVGSLKWVALKTHLQYLVALALIIFGLVLSFLVVRSFLSNLKQISVTMQLSDLRTQYAHLIVYDITNMYMGNPAFPQALEAYNRLDSDLQTFWYYHEATQVPNNDYGQMDFMFGDECIRINKSTCPDSTYKYWDDVGFGLHTLILTFFSMSKGLQVQWGKAPYNFTYTDPLFVEFRTITETDVFDGLETMTFINYRIALDQISSAKVAIGIVAAVESIAFVLIHLIFLRPFVRRLQEESEHTFSIIRMIPRKMVQHIPEIQEFINETVEVD